LLAGLLGAGAAGAQAQVRWSVDPKYSFAWWQMSPHMNHLWATTCPEEPSWRPGEGRSSGWVINDSLRTVYDKGMQGDANVEDTINVPLYPRPVGKVETVCTEAVTGQFVLGDTLRWQNIRGRVAVKADALITGENQRDRFARGAVLQTNRFPEIKFTLDSVMNVTRQGDTLVGKALGTFTLHGVAKPKTVDVRAWPEAGGRRVQARFRMPVKELTSEYGFSKFALGLGVGTKIWRNAFMGVDMILRSDAATGN
jgi:polyisoprenoid-binding protein YceI